MSKRSWSKKILCVSSGITSRSTFDLVTNIVLPFVHVFGKTGRRTLEERAIGTTTYSVTATAVGRFGSVA